MRAVLVILIALANLSLTFDAYAAAGDTTIYVRYSVNVVRTRPTPYSGTGVGNVDFRVVLHADGSVSDAHRVVGGKKGENKSKLGSAPNAVIYRVEDQSTITRTTDAGSHLHKLTIKLVDKKSCTARVEFILKPGYTEFSDYSVLLKQRAFYSRLEMHSAACLITDQ